MPGIEEQLSSEEKLIVKWWELFFEHIKKDLAYVWDEQSKKELQQLEGHAMRIIEILDRLQHYYSKEDIQGYSKEIHNLKLFCSHLKKIEPSKEWIKNIHDDLFRALGEIKSEKRQKETRRGFLKKIAAAFISTGIGLKSAKAQSGTIPYLSPHNRKRAKRSKTQFIILHTTEAGDKSSLNSIYRSGTANYVVLTDGKVYNTIEHDRIAKHAGRSMWNNITNISNVSVGIEVVGYHNKDITSRQYSALKSLLGFLKSIYRLSDVNVLTHSMVAYGTPNRFWRRSHRGRKRCAMQFAKPEVREKLGLNSKQSRDPDVAARRLIIADAFLASVLYGSVQEAQRAENAIDRLDLDSNKISAQRSAWVIARDEYDSQNTRYKFPNGQVMYGDQIESQNLWTSIPNGTEVELNVARAGLPIATDSLPDEKQEDFEGFKVLKEGDTAQIIAGDEYNRYTTIYFLLDGRVRTGAQIDPNSFAILVRPGVRVLIGYIYAGEVTRNRLPRAIAQNAWNHPSTFYRLRNGTIISGDEIESTSIPLNTLVFFRR